MKYAVTAASGQLGAAIVKALTQIVGATAVVGIARTPNKARHLGVEIRKADYNSLTEFTEALKGVNRLVIVSGMDAPEKRILQHRNIIQAAKENGLDKLVYTSIVGDEHKNAFAPIVQSNRATEADVRASGITFAIGRNGIYIDPDLAYVKQYVVDGGIKNCAGEGRCCYTSRTELGKAYAALLLQNDLQGKAFNLVGAPVTQSELAEHINSVYQTQLTYEYINVATFLAQRKAALGDFLGTVIAGIYTGIHDGAYDVPSDFEHVVGRPHASLMHMVKSYFNTVKG